MRRLATLAAAGAFVAAFGVPGAAVAAPGKGTLFGTDANRGNLLTVSPATGAGAVVGPMGVGPVPSLAADSTAALFGGGGGGLPNFYTVNKINGAAALVGNSGLGFAAIGGMDYAADGTLFAAVNIAGDGGTGSDHLATINPATGAAAIIGSFGACGGIVVPSIGGGSCSIEGIEAIAFDAAGTLWGAKSARGFAGAPGLYTINPATGAAAFVGPILDAAGAPASGGLVSLQFACDGTLYGGTARAQFAADGGFLVTVDTNTGLLTFVGGASATGGSSLGALAFELPCDQFTKKVTSGPDDDGDGEIDVAIEIGQLVTTEYDFTMTYVNPGGPPVLIVDTAPAEWIVTEVEGIDVNVDACGESDTADGLHGEVDVFKNGKLGKKCRSSTKILWTPDPDGGEINVVMETRQSPGKNNVKFAPTSCGPLFLNSGPAKVFEIDPVTGEPLRDPMTGELLPPLFTAEPLFLVAVEDVDGDGVIVRDGSGNEDGDALTDLEDVQLGFDPCSVGTGTLFAGTDTEDFAGLPEDRLAATPVEGGVFGVTVIHTPDVFLNGLAPTGTGTLFSGDPGTTGSSDEHEITVIGTLLNTVTGPLPNHQFNEDLAFDGTHVWRAHFFEGPLFKYLPDGTFVDSFAQTDVVGATFVRPADVLWITKWGGRQVGTFDPGTNTFTPVIGPTPTNAGGLAYDIERGILWLGLQGGTVQAYDLTAGAALIAGSQHQPFGAIDDTVDGLAFIAD